jgi:hypothetical protein
MALTQKKPFRHFKDTVERDPQLRDHWYAFATTPTPAGLALGSRGEGIEPVWLTCGGVA